MNIYFDNQLIQTLTTDAAKGCANSFLHASIDAALNPQDEPIHAMLGWPSLLQLLHLGHLFEDIPLFNGENTLYNHILSLLPNESEREKLIEAFDQIFVECLTKVQALPQVRPEFLLQEIQKKQLELQTNLDNFFFVKQLGSYQKRLLEEPKNVMHDLILYLAWDLVCVNLSIIFEHICSHANIESGLTVLKECLLESFKHITSQGRTTPSFFRLMEALYAYQMRNEKIDFHTDEEWLTLCQSAASLRPRQKLCDVWYIDAAIGMYPQSNQMSHEREPLRVFTMDSQETVKASACLAHYMIDLVNTNSSDGFLFLKQVEVTCIKEEEGHLNFSSRFYLEQ